VDWIVCDKKIFVNCITDLVNISQTMSDNDTVLSQASTTQGFISDDATASNNSVRSELDSVSSSQYPGSGGKYSKRRGGKYSKRRGGKYSKRRGHSKRRGGKYSKRRR